MEERKDNRRKGQGRDRGFGNRDPRPRYDRDNRKKEDRSFGSRQESAEKPLLPEDMIIGRNPVTEALKAHKPIDALYVNRGAGGSIGVIIRLAKDNDIVVKESDERTLSRMCGGASHQGVIALCACAEYADVEDILKASAEKGTKPFIIICDGIEDPHNLGAIIRTAEAAGADGIIIPKRHSAGLSSTVYKTSAGAAGVFPVARVSNIVQCIEELKEKGIWIYGTQMDAPSYTQCDLTGAAALVIGSEGFGMSRLVREKCDFLVSLPMNGRINSLNASVAAGIFMYETVRQRCCK